MPIKKLPMSAPEEQVLFWALCTATTGNSAQQREILGTLNQLAQSWAPFIPSLLRIVEGRQFQENLRQMALITIRRYIWCVDINIITFRDEFIRIFQSLEVNFIAEAAIILAEMTVKNRELVPNINEIIITMLQNPSTACAAVDMMREFAAHYEEMGGFSPELAVVLLQVVDSGSVATSDAMSVLRMLADYEFFVRFFLQGDLHNIILRHFEQFDENGRAEAMTIIGDFYCCTKEAVFGDFLATCMATQDADLMMDMLDVVQTYCRDMPCHEKFINGLIFLLNGEEEPLWEEGPITKSQGILMEMADVHGPGFVGAIFQMFQACSPCQILRVIGALDLADPVPEETYGPLVYECLRGPCPGDAALCFLDLDTHKPEVISTMMQILAGCDDGVFDKIVFVLENVLVDLQATSPEWIQILMSVYNGYVNMNSPRCRSLIRLVECLNIEDPAICTTLAQYSWENLGKVSCETVQFFDGDLLRILLPKVGPEYACQVLAFLGANIAWLPMVSTDTLGGYHRVIETIAGSYLPQVASDSNFINIIGVLVEMRENDVEISEFDQVFSIPAHLFAIAGHLFQHFPITQAPFADNWIRLAVEHYNAEANFSVINAIVDCYGPHIQQIPVEIIDRFLANSCGVIQRITESIVIEDPGKVVQFIRALIDLRVRLENPPDIIVPLTEVIRKMFV